MPYDLFDVVVENAKRIVAAAGMDVAGVEYLISVQGRRSTFCNLNALSSFVADASGGVGCAAMAVT